MCKPKGLTRGSAIAAPGYGSLSVPKYAAINAPRACLPSFINVRVSEPWSTMVSVFRALRNGWLRFVNRLRRPRWCRDKDTCPRQPKVNRKNGVQARRRFDAPLPAKGDSATAAGVRQRAEA